MTSHKLVQLIYGHIKYILFFNVTIDAGDNVNILMGAFKLCVLLSLKFLEMTLTMQKFSLGLCF